MEQQLVEEQEPAKKREPAEELELVEEWGQLWNRRAGCSLQGNRTAAQSFNS